MDVHFGVGVDQRNAYLRILKERLAKLSAIILSVFPGAGIQKDRKPAFPPSAQAAESLVV